MIRSDILGICATYDHDPPDKSAINSPELGNFGDLLAVLSIDSTITVTPLFLISFTSKSQRETIIVRVSLREIIGCINIQSIINSI